MHDIINVNSLTKDYGGGRGIFDFDFSVRRGEVFGIVGTNGSGKTTTMRHLMGFLHPDKGNCSILGMDCSTRSNDIMKHVGYVPGEIDFPDVGSGTSFLKIQADFQGIKDKSYINELADMFKLDTSAPLKRMSKGMKQKTALVAAFMSKPDILLLDEPSTGLDPLMRDTLIELILTEKKRGATILMSSHIFKELDDTADRILFIKDGRMQELIERSQLEGTSETYRLGFKTSADYDSFLSSTKLRLIHRNKEHLHIDTSVNRNELTKLFAEAGKFDLRYIRNRPFTIENYYNSKIEKGGKESA